MISMPKDPDLKRNVLRPRVVTIGWSLSIISIIYLLFSIYPWNNGSKADPIVAVIYGSLHRTLWSAAFAWIVFACIHGKGGLVDKILSFGPFIPLSRLTFSVYLVHPIIHWIKLGSIRERLVVSHSDGVSDQWVNANPLKDKLSQQIYAFISTVVLSFAFGFVCTLLCESPLLAIEKQFLKHRNQIKQKCHWFLSFRIQFFFDKNFKLFNYKNITII